LGSSVGRRLGGLELSVHDHALALHDLVLTFSDSRLPLDHVDLTGSNEDSKSGQPQRPPLCRRFVLSISLLLSGLFLAFRDRKYANDNGRVLSSPEILGLLLSGCGLAVWWITFAFPASWGWWL